MAYTVIQALIIGIVIYQWRSAMGVGQFQSAKLTVERFNYLIKYKNFEGIFINSQNKIPDYITTERDGINRYYKLRKSGHYIVGGIGVVFLLFLFHTSFKSEYSTNNKTTIIHKTTSEIELNSKSKKIIIAEMNQANKLNHVIYNFDRKEGHQWITVIFFYTLVILSFLGEIVVMSRFAVIQEANERLNTEINNFRKGMEKLDS